ncbi:uncharacterized protein [Dermacentor albipictus]|uniref:uncharacterized protein isoform X2 n=1 Tax=Dermacentor albipictus TaxID=60249 RepID=UPI0038FCB674
MPNTARDHKVSPSPPATASAGASPKSDFSDAGDDILAAIALQDETTDWTAPPAAGDEDDRLSSVSQATAVASPALAGDRGERGQARLHEIEDEIQQYCSNAANKVPVAARGFIAGRLYEIVRMYSDLRSDVLVERGAAGALRGELVEARREVAALQRRAIVAEGRLDGSIVMAPSPRSAGRDPGASAAAAGSGPGVPAAAAGAVSYAAALRASPAAGSSGGGARTAPTFEHVAFLTPTVPTTTPARDALRLLKTNIDPAAKNIGEVTLRHTSLNLRAYLPRDADTIHPTTDCVVAFGAGPQEALAASTGQITGTLHRLSFLRYLCDAAAAVTETRLPSTPRKGCHDFVSQRNLHHLGACGTSAG